MAMPKLNPEQIAQLSGLVAKFISTQQQKYTPRAIRFSAQQKTAMAGFFPPQLIDDTRLHVLHANGWTTQILPDAKKLGLQQSRRPVRYGSGYVL
jgi:hypothetical protein